MHYTYHTQNVTHQYYSFLIVLGLLLFSKNIKAQTFYAMEAGCDQLFTVNVNSSTCECELTTIVTGPACAIGHVTFCTDGEFYVYGEAPTPGIYLYDLATGALSLAYALPTSPPGIGPRGLICVGDGIFYMGWYNDPGSNWLYRFNTNENTLTNLGLINHNTGSEWVLYEGEIYAWGWGNGLLIRIDTINPSNSPVICDTYPPFLGTAGLTASPFCHSLLGCGPNVDTIYSINLLDCSVRPLCHIANGIWWLMSVLEFEVSPLCSGSIDLDCDNSSGATGSDYNAEPFSCLTEGGVGIADIDVSIFIDDIIEEMTIELIDPLPDLPDEVLLSGGSPGNISVSGSNSTLITLTNTGGADIRDFEEALRQVAYNNAVLYPTAGIRTVLVQFTTIAGTQSNIASAFIEVVELPIIMPDIGPDQVRCDGETATFNAGIPGAQYMWSNGGQSQSITVGEAGEYIVTVSDGVNCPGQDTVELEIIPVIHVSLEGDTERCENEPDSLLIITDSPFPLTVEITPDPGSPITFTDVMGVYLFTDFPFDITEYSITEVIPSQPGCVVITDPTQVVDVLPIYFGTSQMSICDGDSVLLGNTWVSEAGEYEVVLQSIDGCDSTIDYTIDILPAEFIAYQNFTCDSSALGIFITHLENANGCDTVVQTTVSLSPSDTTAFQLSSCSSADTGIFTLYLTNQEGCDSLIITTVTFIPPADTTQFFFTSCDTSLMGIFQELWTDQNGCDSLVVITVGEGTPDTTHLAITSCDSSSLGVFEEHFLSSSGCDSTVFTTVSYSLNDSTFISSHSCSPVDTGTFLQTFINQFGCDSIVTLDISLAANHEVFIQTSSCDPADTGVFVQMLVNALGCDSIVTQTIGLLPSDETFLFGSTCDPADAGMFITTHFNQHGCDSNVTLTISLIPSDTTVLSTGTCNPGMVGTTENLFTNQSGCDSLVIQQTTLFPLPELFVEVTSDYNGFDISCFGESDGSASANVSGVAPWTYAWSTGDMVQELTGLSSGTYSVTVTDGNGCEVGGAVTLFDPEPFGIQLVISHPDCFDQQKGSITIEQSGGIIPIRYSIDGVNFQTSPVFEDLGGGTYEITAIDGNDCEAKEIVWINVPLLVDVSLGDDQFITLGNSTIIHAVVNIPFDSLSSIVWTGLSNPDCPNCLTQPVAPIITTTYSISVTSAEGCTDQDELTIFLEEESEVYIPNVFSPNGDNLNDLLLITAGPQIEEIISFTIYDRWGNVVFEATHFVPNDPDKSWDGTMKGEPMNNGVFAFKLMVEGSDGKPKVLYGDVTLIR